MQERVEGTRPDEAGRSDVVWFFDAALDVVFGARHLVVGFAFGRRHDDDSGDGVRRRKPHLEQVYTSGATRLGVSALSWFLSWSSPLFGRVHVSEESLGARHRASSRRSPDSIFYCADPWMEDANYIEHEHEHASAHDIY